MYPLVSLGLPPPPPPHGIPFILGHQEGWVFQESTSPPRKSEHLMGPYPAHCPAGTEIENSSHHDYPP